MESKETDSTKTAEPVSKSELNSWRRGFTPQAEIWNGRMAIIGLAIGLGFLLFFNLLVSNSIKKSKNFCYDLNTDL